MGKVKKRPDKKAKAKQTFIEGMAPIRIAAIDAKAEALIELKHERSRLTDDINATQEALIDLILKHEVDGYVVEVDGTHYRFELSKETRVKPKKVKIKVESNDGSSP